MMYATYNGNRVKSQEARELSKEVEKIIERMPMEEILGELKVEIIIHSNWYNKNGSIKKRDIANLEKFITDSIFNALPSMDDKQIFEISLKKVQDEEEFALIKIKQNI